MSTKRKPQKCIETAWTGGAKWLAEGQMDNARERFPGSTVKVVRRRGGFAVVACGGAGLAGARRRRKRRR